MSAPRHFTMVLSSRSEGNLTASSATTLGAGTTSFATAGHATMSTTVRKQPPRVTPDSLDNRSDDISDHAAANGIDGWDVHYSEALEYPSRNRTASKASDHRQECARNPDTHPAVRSKKPLTSSSPMSSAVVDPPTVPTRTSSSRALQADRPGSPKANKSPRKHRSLAALPERGNPRLDVAEGSWMGQTRPARHTMSSGTHPQYLSQRSASPTLPEEARAERVGHKRETSAALNSPNVLGGVGADLISGQSLGWSAEKENILKGPFDYLEANPGKDVRTQLITAFNAWLQVPPSSLRVITRVVAMLHTASLLIDDVEDGSQLRRGIPVAHAIFGTAQTINSANYVYFCALQELTKLHNPDAIHIYTEELLNLHRGQGMDLFWRDTLTCPSEDDYLEMVGNKTGGLFRLAIKLMCTESPTHNRIDRNSAGSSNSPPDYVPLVNSIGLLFQILDDYKNLSDTTYTHNKGLCEDLTEGKFSFPIIHAIRADPSNLVLINILKQKTTDDDVKKFAVGFMEAVGSFSYTRRVLRGLTKKAMQLVEEVDAGRGKGDGVTTVLERLRLERHMRASQSV